MGVFYTLQTLLLLLLMLTTIPVDFSNAHERGVSCPSACHCLGGTVDCSKKGLISVPIDLPGWVQMLDLSGNAIVSVAVDSFDGLDHLNEINLNNNKLMSINMSFYLLPQLRTLKLSHNQLIDLPSMDVWGCNLTHLILSHNEIRSIDPSFLSSLPNLQILDLSFNKLSRLTNGSFPFLVELRELFLNNNELTNMERGAFDFFPCLELLKLNKNKIKILQKNIFAQLRKLKYLELERNRVHTIDGLVFQGLDSLESLKLQKNVITTLNDGALWGLGKILKLDLSHNNISTVNKKWLYGLDTLEQLSLAHNRLTTVESDAWRSCKKVRELDLRHNNLSWLNERMFENLDSLRNLTLSHNRLSYIADSAFFGLAGLHMLDLSDNDISWTIEDVNMAFDSLLSLTRLVLKNNRIKSISTRAFQGLIKLRQLHLEGNDISTIQVNAFETMKELRNFHLNTSYLLCDCHLSWLARWLTDSGFQSMVDVHCGYPENLSGSSIFNVDPNNFKCVNFPRPVITREPEAQNAVKLSNVSLSCEAASSSSSTLSIEWKKDNKVFREVPSLDTVHPAADDNLVRVTSVLHIEPVQDSHAGTYQCIASNVIGSSYSVKAVVTVNIFPTFVKMPANIVVKAGTTARLDCAAIGFPLPEIALQKDGGDDFPAARERRMHIFPSDDMFFIVEVKLEDQGVYTCMAKNDVGVITANATLQVLEAPSFARRMENKVSSMGDTTVLECMTAGNPRPRVEWRKDLKPLQPTLRHFFTADDQLLIIVQTQRDDAGDYTCVMTNALGSEHQTSHVTVLDNDAGIVASDSIDPTTTTGVVIIVVVCCVVGTSLIWVIVIYRTRRRAWGGRKHEDGAMVRSYCGGQLGVGGGSNVGDLSVVGGNVGRGYGGQSAGCCRRAESIGNSSAQRLFCPTQATSLASVEVSGGGAGIGALGGYSVHKLRSAALFLQDNDVGPRRHSYCFSDHCCNQSLQHDETPAVTRHRSDSGAHSASSSLSGSTNTDNAGGGGEGGECGGVGRLTFQNLRHCSNVGATRSGDDVILGCNSERSTTDALVNGVTSRAELNQEPNMHTVVSTVTQDDDANHDDSNNELIPNMDDVNSINLDQTHFAPKISHVLNNSKTCRHHNMPTTITQLNSTYGFNCDHHLPEDYTRTSDCSVHCCNDVDCTTLHRQSHDAAEYYNVSNRKRTPINVDDNVLHQLSPLLATDRTTCSDVTCNALG